MARTLRITAPDDWHLHLREGSLLAAAVGHSAARFRRALVMPNLVPPVTTAGRAAEYRDEILACLPPGSGFDPVMTLYLTDNTTTAMVAEAADAPHVAGFKLYPAGATTHSDSGVTSIHRVMPALEAMADKGLVLQVHGEVTDDHVDVFDREAVFIDQVLAPLCRELPELRVILEHITTSDGIGFVQSGGDNIAGTLTAHHLLYCRNDLFRSGIRPHYYCLPVLKRRRHQEALLGAATSGNPSFFLGTDSAPHLRGQKESSCGCAGIFTAHAALELYAEIFDGMNALDRLEGFASHFGADFYRVPRNTDEVILEEFAWEVPASYPVPGLPGDDPALSEFVPLRAGETVGWRIRRTDAGDPGEAAVD